MRVLKVTNMYTDSLFGRENLSQIRSKLKRKKKFWFPIVFRY